MGQQEDDVWWAGIRSGDAQALGWLMKRHYRALIHYGTKFTTDLALLEDSVQDLFLELWQRQDQLPLPASVRHYLFKAYRNQLLKALTRRPPTIGAGYSEEPPDLALTAEDMLIRFETEITTREHVQQVLGTLTTRQREAVYLRYYEALSNEQIADLMGIHRQSVANLLQQALQKLRVVWVLIGLIVVIRLFIRP